MCLRLYALTVSVAALMSLLIPSPDLLSGQALSASCSGGAGGVFTAGRTDVVYSVSYTAGGKQLDAAVLVHGPEAWRRLPPPDSSPARWRPDGKFHPVTGATTGPLWIGYERGAGTLWLGADSVALGAANMAMVEVDSAGRPHVVEITHVEPRLQAAGPPCRAPAGEKETLAFTAALLKVVRSDTTARAFLDQ